MKKYAVSLFNYPGDLSMTIEQLERIHQHFWKEEMARFFGRLSHRDIVGIATDLMRADSRLPFAYRKTFEAAAQEATAAKRRVMFELGRSGRQARKPDALQQLIEQLVRRRPSVTESQLVRLLEEHSGIEPIVEISEGKIFYTRPDGIERSAPLSGLKDRLSRAKKRLSR